MSVAVSPKSASGRMVKTTVPGIFKCDNRYVVVYRDLARKQRKKSCLTMAEAKTFKATVTADLARGEYRSQTRVSFVDYAKTWIETYDGRTDRGIRPGTVRSYRRDLGLDNDGKPTGDGAVAFFGRTPLAAITAQHVKQYAAECVTKGLAKNTVRLKVAVVKALLATAHEEGLIRANPAARLRLGRTVKDAPVKETHALSEEQLVRVLAEVPERHRLLIELLAQTGLRISEALALTKADIDFGQRRLSVSKRLADGELDAPKTENGVRQVPLSPGLARQLWTRLAMRRATRSCSRRRRVRRSTGRSCTRSSVRRVSGRASSSRSGCMCLGTRARRSCFGAVCRRRRFVGCWGITRGSSRRGRICIWTTMICRMGRLWEISSRVSSRPSAILTR